MPHLIALRAVSARLATLALGCLVILGPGLGLSPTDATGPAPESDPLVVHIDTISPVLPRRGNVKITGTVTNVSDDTYSRINLHAFASRSPLTDASTLAASAASDPNASVGERVTEPGTFDTVDLLEPGESATFKDSIPVELFQIPDEPGVYWIGIHALGDGPEMRDGVADGRARTFIPLLPRKTRTMEAAVILPLRGRVWFDKEGRVGGAARWARWLGDEGRLEASLDIAESAGTHPYSWLVDPAILVALVHISQGNPPRSLAPDPTAPGQETADSPPAADSDGSDKQTDQERALAEAASSWLNRFLTMAADEPVLALPFGDLDVSAAVRHAPQRYDEAVARSASVMSDLTLGSRAALAPENDVLSAEALELAAPGTIILLGDNAFVAPPKTAHSVVKRLGHKILVTSTGAESGGPGPTAADDPLALRQRLLSEAAIRLVSDSAAPVVISLPTPWRPADADVFFTGLDQPWLNVVGVPKVAARSATEVPANSLAYTRTDAKAELKAGNFTAAARATERAGVLEDVLTLQTLIESQVRDEVLVTLSQQHRVKPHLGIRSADRVTDSLQEDLDEIRVEAPTSVTLSGDHGNTGASLINGLDEPVTVRLVATTDGALTLSTPGVKQLGPGSRSLVKIEASTKQLGIFEVNLTVTTVDGTPLGSVDDFPIRAARVSALIWIVLAAGALVLLGALGHRLPGQIRARRVEQAAAAAAAAADSSDPKQENA